MTTTTQLYKTAQEIRGEISKLQSWLEIPSVQASSHWTNDIKSKIARLQGELKQVRSERLGRAA